MKITEVAQKLITEIEQDIQKHERNQITLQGALQGVAALHSRLLELEMIEKEKENGKDNNPPKGAKEGPEESEE